jgi:hypothetical protein
MTMAMNSPEPDDVLNARRTVVLAEAILTIWLGALQSPCPHLQSLRPWEAHFLDCTPWSSHNPLTFDVMEPVRGTSESEITDNEALGTDHESTLDTD